MHNRRQLLTAITVVFCAAGGRRGGVGRASPRRSIDWHGVGKDTVGGRPVSLAYCTLGGAAVLYDTRVGEVTYTFGSSGLLMRSNKLMFDQGTKSLWNTFEGVPVIGSLVGSGLQLTRRSMVTTTWAEWRARHPETTVLSLETGQQRDYSEGRHIGITSAPTG